MIPYFYILGMSHSGSTLLAFLLNTHPEIITVGETVRITEILPDRWARKVDLCSCGKTYFYDDFWNRVLAGLAARGYGLGEPDFFQYQSAHKDLADLKLQALISAILEVSERSIYLDASKDSFAVKPLSANPYLEYKILDLYRDGRGILHSWKKRLTDVPLKKLIREWMAREKKRQAALRLVAPNRICKVKYENLCNDTLGEMTRIYKFIGVEADGESASGYKTQTEHHIIGNQMRLDQNESIQLDEEWRTAWDARMFKRFKRMGGQKVNFDNGYPE